MFIPVTLRMSNSRETQVNALIDSGASLNFISQLKVKELGLRGHSDAPHGIRSLSGHVMSTYQTHDIETSVTDSNGKTQRHTDSYVAASFTGCDLILGITWLQERDPDIRWANGTLTWRKSLSEDTPDAIDVVHPIAFAACISEEDLRPYQIIVTQDASGSEAGVLWGTTMSNSLPEEYSDYERVFSEEGANELASHGPQDHAIDTQGQQPPFGPLYPLSNLELKVLREYITENLAKGFIQASSSPAGAPIIFVKKKDGTLRLCVDYRGLNRITLKNRYPLPLISEALDRLVGAKVYSKLDIRSAYNLIRIKEGDEWKTAFRTRYGHYEYKVMPFGLANAPATFQSYINYVLRDFLDVFCIAYLDDILIFSDTRAEHTQHVRRVLSRLAKYRLFARLDKCEFYVTQVGFVGFIVSPAGVEMERSRIATIQDWPTPKTHRDIQVFLGFANFYRRFIASYSQVARPLNELLRGSVKGKFTGQTLVMSDEAIAAFQELKRCFTSAPILRHFDPALPIQLETDASKYAIAGILSQSDSGDTQAHWRPVAYWSRSLKEAELNYGVGDAEMLAIVEACKQWRHYLEGATHAIRCLTDHANLRTFLSTKTLRGKYARWWEILSALDLNISYRAGKLNPADAPSRRPDYEERARQEAAALEQDSGSPLGDEARLSVASVTSEPGLRFEPDLETTQDNTVANNATYSLRLTATVMLSRSRKPRPVVPLNEVRESAKAEDAYSDPTLEFRRLIARLQQDDELAQGLITFLSLTKEQRLALASAETQGGAGEASWMPPGGDDPDWNVSGGVLYHGTQAYLPSPSRGEAMRSNHDDPHAGHFGYLRTLELVRRKYYWPGMSRDIKQYVRTCNACARSKAIRHKPHGQLQSLPAPQGVWKDLTMDFITDLPPAGRKGHSYDAILVVVDRLSKMAMYIPTRKSLDAAGLADLFYRRIWKDYGVPTSIVTDRGTQFTSKFWSAFCYQLRIKRRLSTAFHPQTDGQTERQNQTLEQYLRSYVNYQQDDWLEWLTSAEFAYNNSVHSTTGMTPFYAVRGEHPNTGDELPREACDLPAVNVRLDAVNKLRKELTARWKEAVAKQAEYYDAKHKPMDYAIDDMVWLSGRNIRTARPSKKLDYKYYGPYRIVDAIGEQAYRLSLPEGTKIHPVFHVSLLEPYKAGEDRSDAGALPLRVPSDDDLVVGKVLDSKLHYGKLKYLVSYEDRGDFENEWLSAPELDTTQALRKLVSDFHERYPTKANKLTEERHQRKPRQRRNRVAT